MLQSDKVQSSEEGKLKLKQAYKEAKLTQEELAQKAKVSIDTVKRLRVHPNFAKIPECDRQRVIVKNDNHPEATLLGKLRQAIVKVAAIGQDTDRNSKQIENHDPPRATASTSLHH